MTKIINLKNQKHQNYKLTQFNLLSKVFPNGVLDTNFLRYNEIYLKGYILYYGFAD